MNTKPAAQLLKPSLLTLEDRCVLAPFVFNGGTLIINLPEIGSRNVVLAAQLGNMIINGALAGGKNSFMSGAPGGKPALNTINAIQLHSSKQNDIFNISGVGA